MRANSWAELEPLVAVAYDATGNRDELTRMALQRANIMRVVDLKRGGHSPHRTEMRIDRVTDRSQSFPILSKSAPPVA
jgi:hypothetical protein